MTAPFEITGVPTRAKAEEIARTMRALFPDWTVEVRGDAAPYAVRRTPPGAPAAAAPVAGSDRAGVEGFLDFIANYESRGNYNARFGAAANTDDPAFIEMNVDEVLDWQEGRKFSACGKYQIIRATLLDLKAMLGLGGGERFDPALQDRMGRRLLERRGLDAFLAGDMERDLFALSVAREWAALPRVAPPNADKSVYAGDGVNQALVGVAEYVEALDRLKAAA